MKLLLSCVFIFSTIVANAQFGNEWINYNQSYYSFKIVEDGVYKLDYNTLSNAGIPLATTQSNQFQLWGFEKEQAIFIEDGGDNSIDPGDYILFYGQKNTTWLDSLLFDSPSSMGNRYFPLYNDTITYFLTYNNSSNNLRIQEETDVAYNSYSPSPYFIQNRSIGYNIYYAHGYKTAGTSYSEYVSGEGWSSNYYNALWGGGNFKNTIFNTSHVYTGIGAPDVKVSSAIASLSNAPFTGSANHHLQINVNNTPYFDTLFSAYVKVNHSFSFAPTVITSNSTTIQHKAVNDQGAASDYQSVFYVDLSYPHTPNLDNSSYVDIDLVNGTGAKTRLDFTNFNSNSPIAFAFDGVLKKIPVTQNASTHQVIVPNANSGKQKFVLLDETEIMTVQSIEAVNGSGLFTDFSNSDFNDAYIIISHPKLWSSATQYKDYRASVAGGSKNCILANIEELYLQFGGGVPKQIMGIRRFEHYAFNSALNEKPNHVFLIGKGIREASEGTALANHDGARLNITSYKNCLVPTFGYPASDALISHNLEGNIMSPLIPIGRLAATTDNDVITYLDKVKDYELVQSQTSVYTIQNKLWQKEILHFGGGSTSFEQSLFKSYLSNYESKLEDTLFGGNVHSYYKTTSDPINPVSLSEVTDRINEGVSFMTFFGHASAVTGFDSNVDDPNNWSNSGKYPIVVGNSCLTGNIHEPNVFSTSQEYVLIEDKGAIAFMANVNAGYPSGLNQFSDQLFTQISKSNYGATIGQQHQMACHTLSQNSVSFSLRTTLGQMTLHGDPALRPNYHTKPEIVIEEPGFYITPNKLDLTIDSIDLNLVVYNLGRSVTDTFRIEFIRHFPDDGGDSSYFLEMAGLNYIDTVSITIPFYANQGTGINRFEVNVDIPNFIQEQYDEQQNNRIEKSVVFDIDGIQPIWPYNFAVVPNDTASLKASTINPFAEFNSYKFEVDTTDLFNSPFLRHSFTSSTGGVISVAPNEWLNQSELPSALQFQDSTVYFWRVGLNDPGNYNWREFSFQYIKGKNGWGQDHFFQFKNNDFDFLTHNRTDRILEFNENPQILRCQVKGNATSAALAGKTNFTIGPYGDENYCTTIPKLLVAVIDPITLQPWGTRDNSNGFVENPNHNFGNSNDMSHPNNCRLRVKEFFAFDQNDQTQLTAFENLIQTVVPDSFYVLIYTARFLNYAQWDIHSPQIYNTFQNLGFDSVAVNKPSVPFIGFYQKGNPSSVKEVYGASLTELIAFEDTLVGLTSNAFETTPKIGPARAWEAIYWDQGTLDINNEDSTRLRLYGINYYGLKTLLIDTIFTVNDSILNLESIVDHNNYPLIQLQAQLLDETNGTPAQINRWHVLYKPVPEAAITSTKGYYLTQDSLQEGDKIVAQFDITNISDYPMDSLKVDYWIEKSNHQLIPLPYPLQDSLRVGGLLQDTLSIPTNGLTELNSLWVEVNPFGPNNIKHQPEMYHFNNIGQIPFKVVNDDENPILQVSFDNRFILNGDLVSPISEVIISLKDENPFLLLNEEADTALFGIYLTDPNGVQKRLNFKNGAGEQLLEWIPANANSKKFKIIYQGEFPLDGTYRLLVQGADKSGNISGDLDYDIEFEVDHESTITQLMNYPNPFSTQTQFVFTLTGAAVPDEFTIQILTVTGKLVRTITRDELGDIHIGRNITDYRWDGKDEFGDQLANGVYLYRVKTSINGEDVDLRESGADQYFTKGFGKMYLLK
ncbi:MAG: C25 family cysteine peptidase [Crocinitomicaceae bacterium]